MSIQFPSLLEKIKEWELLNCFYSLSHRETLQAMFAIVERVGSSDVPLEPMLISHFEDEKRVAFIMESPSVRLQEFPQLCRHVKEFDFRRRLKLTLESAISQAESLESPLSDVVRQVETDSILFSQELNNSAQKWTGKNGELISMREYLDTPDQTILKTGLTDLDSMIRFAPGTMVIFCGRPSMGKSMAGVFFANNFALDQGQPTLFVSLEMEARDLQTRRISAMSNIDSQMILDRALNPEQREIVLSWEEYINQSPLHYDCNPESTLSTIRSSIRRVIQREGRISAFVVDYLQLMSRQTKDKQNELDLIGKGLRALGREFNIPCIALAQLNRDTEGQKDKRPTLSSIRGSGTIEQHGDVIVGLYRDDYYYPNSSDKGVTEFIVLKNRNGSVGTVRAIHELEFSRYKSLLR